MPNHSGASESNCSAFASPALSLSHILSFKDTGMLHHAGFHVDWIRICSPRLEVFTWSNLHCACYSALGSLPDILGEEEHGGI